MSLSFTYAEVPKDIKENLRYRQAVLKLGDTVELARPAILDAAGKDFLWWLNTFAWLFEPRPDVDANTGLEGKIRPFVSWPHQDVGFREMELSWGRDDIGVIKSRAEGASWLILMRMLWGWRFHEMEAYGLVSRNEMAVDNPRDPNSLMWKLDWALTKLPKWMIDPKDVQRNRNEHALVYTPNGSTIIGNSATGDVARGGRATVFLMDEFAAFGSPEDTRALDSTRDVTNCRIFLSTPQGPVGAYYEIMRNPGNMRRIGLWWHDNPTKNKGLYRVVNGRVQLVDYDYWMERTGIKNKDILDRHANEVQHLDESNIFHYGFMTTGEFIKEGAYRSPWYDRQCQRPGTTPRSIAQELDGDFGGSVTRWFNVQKIDQLIDRCRSPLFVGDFVYDHLEPKRAAPLDGGKGFFRVYSSFLVGQRIPNRDHIYTLGVDIAAGGSGHEGSNSVIAVCDATTKEICAEYASPHIAPHELAELAYCLGHFYRNAGGALPCVIPEINGLGDICLQRLKQIGYPHIYERKSEDKRTRKTTKKLGFHSNTGSKKALLGEFRRAVESEELSIYGKACLEETKQYMLFADGSIEHIGAEACEDPSGAGQNHGDRVIATACAWKAAQELGLAKKQEQRQARSREPSLMTFSGRMTKREERAQKTTSQW